jgi:putative ABC transport system permease protein
MRTRARDDLSQSTRGVVGDRWNHRVRNTLVVAEICAALVLLLATTLLVQNLLRLQRVHPGFNPDAVFQARVSLPPSFTSTDAMTRFYDELAARIAGLPGVRSVGLISVAPMSGLLSAVPFTVAGRPPLTEREEPTANLRVITPDYPAAVGTRLLRGRLFSQSDRSDTVPVALVSEALAQKFLSEEPLGQRLHIDDNNQGPRPVEVVGVLENVRQAALEGPHSADIYIPLSQVHPDGVSFLRSNQFWMIRTDTNPAAFRGPFLTHLRAVNQDAAISDMGTMSQYLEAWLAPRRFSLALFVAFSLTAVLLAVSGLYGLVSYSVSHRKRELGLRVALGATGLDVQRLILGQAARLTLAGSASGLGVSLIAYPLVTRFAKDIPIDPGAMIAVTGLLCVVVALAGWLPARRAARVAPALVLKGE